MNKKDIPCIQGSTIPIMLKPYSPSQYLVQLWRNLEASSREQQRKRSEEKKEKELKERLEMKIDFM